MQLNLKLSDYHKTQMFLLQSVLLLVFFFSGMLRNVQVFFFQEKIVVIAILKPDYSTSTNCPFTHILNIFLKKKKVNLNICFNYDKNIMKMKQIKLNERMVLKTQLYYVVYSIFSYLSVVFSTSFNFQPYFLI